MGDEKGRGEESVEKSHEEEWLLSIHARYGSEMITIMEPWGVPRYESPVIDRMLGYRPMDHFDGDPSGGAWTEMIHPDDVPKMSESVKQSISRPGEHPPVEYRIKDAEGRWRWFESRGINLVDDPGIAGIVVSTREITDRKRTECALAESEKLLRAVAEGAPLILFAFDADGVITFDAGRGLSALGLSPGSSVGLSVFEMYEDDPRVLDNLRRALAGEEVSDTVELAAPSGKLFFDTRYSPLRDAAGEVEAVVGVATDVTERKRLEEKLAHRATHDPLTDLPNRILFMDRLCHALKRAGRTLEPTAILFLDLDGFKSVNDSWGHGAGDALLVGVSRRLEGALRYTDTVCRLGGDEFAILLEDSGREEAARTARRIMEELARPFDVPEAGSETTMTASIGIAIAPGAGGREDTEKEAESLVQTADRAMYRVKASGKAGYRRA